MLPCFHKLPVPAKLNVLLEPKLELEAILQRSLPSASCVIEKPLGNSPHVKLFHHGPMLRAPSQTLLRTPPLQALLHPMALHKNLHIDQFLNALLLRQRLGALPVAAPQQIIHQQPIQPNAGPLVVLDVGQTGYVVQVL